MMLKELEPQLLALSDEEKAQVVQLLSQGKIILGRGIEKTPDVCGGSACIAGTRITVWGLVEARRLGYSEANLLTSYPSLSATDLANAWAYAEAFPDEIETEIQKNGEVMHEKLVSFPTSSNRIASLGCDRGKLVLPEDFNAPLPKEILAAFEGDEA